MEAGLFRRRMLLLPSPAFRSADCFLVVPIDLGVPHLPPVLVDDLAAVEGVKEVRRHLCLEGFLQNLVHLTKMLV